MTTDDTYVLPEVDPAVSRVLDLVDQAHVKISQAAACARLLAAVISSNSLDEIHNEDASYVSMLVGDLSREAVEAVDQLHEMHKAATRGNEEVQP